jgi:hypothetical protein
MPLQAGSQTFPAAHWQSAPSPLFLQILTYLPVPAQIELQFAKQVLQLKSFGPIQQ